jgi:hypothetical protein
LVVVWKSHAATSAPEADEETAAMATMERMVFMGGTL